MPLTKQEQQLTVLNSKKEMLFRRVQVLFNESKKISNPTNLNNFKVRFKSLESTREQFTEVIENINLLTLEIDPEALPNFAALDSFDELYCHIQSVAEKVFETNKVDSPVVTRKVTRLPELELPVFSGNLKDWPIFYECFKSLIHDNKDLSDTDKVNFLVSKLSGAAKNICSGLPPIADNYSIIWNALIEKYQDNRKLANCYLEKLFEFKTLPYESFSGLNSFIENFDSSVSAFKKLDIEDKFDYMLSFLALSKLDSNTRRAFEMSRRNTELPTYKEIVDFVKLHVRALSSSSTSNSYKGSTQLSRASSSGTKPKPTQTFVISKTQGNKKCFACCQNVDHMLYRCPKFLNSTPIERYNIVKTNNCCLNCLSSHKIKNCKSKINCSHCHLRHHTLLHFDKPTSANANDSNSNGTSHNKPSKIETPSINDSTSSLCTIRSGPPCNTTVLLSTVIVDVYTNDENIHKLRFLVDSGSQSLGAKINTVEGKTNLIITSHIDSRKKYAIDVFVIDKISNQLPNVKVDIESLAFLKNLPLADNTFHQPGDIDGILGSDIFATILGTTKIVGPLGFPIAVESSLGYIVIGSAPTTQHLKTTQNFCTFLEPSVENLLAKFWEIEEISPSTSVTSTEDTICENIYKSTVKRESTGRYSVALPFKEDPSCLGDSYSVAHRRFLSLERKFHNSITLKQEYNQAMQDYISQNHISEVDKNEPLYPGYYIPHHAVVKLDSVSTKVRIVFDGSCKTSSSKSLNDILYVGPKFQIDIFKMLLNFRLFAVAMTADIRQMYRQINICNGHRRYQRLLWRSSFEEPISIYQINTVAFGIASSPYLALRTIRQLASDESASFPNAAKSIVEDMYVDDYCVSVSSADEAIKLCKEMVELCKSGGFSLVKWSSNSTELLSEIPEHNRLSQSVSFDDGLKVLGLQWQPDLDIITYKVNVPSPACSKRTILSTIARLFDPLGIVAPVVLTAKLLIQELWALKLNWDESPPMHIDNIWSQFIKELPCLSNLQMQRHVKVYSDSSISLIGFADGSQRAYAAVVYLRTVIEDDVNVSLLCAKSKVAPLKTISIPRLELCAAHLLAKLLRSVIDSYQSRIKFGNVFAFSDSTIVLNWINSSPHKWKVFVANRVSKIHELLPSVKWFHVSTNMNPADLASRGLNPRSLIENNLWFAGPSWLRYDREDWPVKSYSGEVETSLEKRMISLASFQDNDEFNCIYNLISRASNWLKLLRSMVYVLRFCKILKSKSFITASDLQKAEETLIIIIQKRHFLEDIEMLKNNKECSPNLRKLRPFLHNNLLCVGGRLSNANLDFEQQHPILLPKKEHFVDLLVDYYHIRNLHTGPSLVLALLRQKYWILTARNVVRKRIQSCNQCFKFKPKNTFPLMADLPACRVQEAKAFVHTGTDYAGPIQISISRRRGQKTQKAYICIFICLVTKALHIELTTDLSTNSFLLAFKRFIARRGPVSTLYSDCGLNYIGAKSNLDELYKLVTSKEYLDQFHNELSQRKINWKFNPPSSPHFGGIWESNIKSIKSHLYKTIGSQILTYEELQTLLCSIEAILNSRPLCILSNDPSDPSALTPAHFLTLTPLQYIPMADLSKIPTNHLDRFQLVDQMIQNFWRRWHLEYLTSLQVREKWNTNSQNIQPGAIVLIKQDNLQPLQWPLGIVEETFSGKDGIVRVVSVRTKQGLLKRPVVKLCPLPTQ